MIGETLGHYKILDLDPRSQVLGHNLISRTLWQKFGLWHAEMLAAVHPRISATTSFLVSRVRIRRCARPRTFPLA